MVRTVALLLVASLVAPVGVLAQTAVSAQQPQQPPPQPPVPANPEPAMDPAKMGVDLSRIKRELSEPESAEGGDSALKLAFTVQVIGVAPKIDFLEGFSVEGPIPYGAPTHQEVLYVLTPQEYRSGTVPLFGLATMAAQKLIQYSKKRRCEAEIEEYRRLVMQGVAVAAPRCSQ